MFKERQRIYPEDHVPACTPAPAYPLETIIRLQNLLAKGIPQRFADEDHASGSCNHEQIKEQLDARYGRATIPQDGNNRKGAATSSAAVSQIRFGAWL